MPYEIRALKKNRTLYVSVMQDGQEVSVPVRNDNSVYSDTLTQDMSNLQRMSYIVCLRVPRKPEAEAEEELGAAEDSAESTVESDDTSEYYTESELRSLKKSELIDLIEQYELSVDTDRNKADILEDLLLIDIPKE